MSTKIKVKTLWDAQDGHCYFCDCDTYLKAKNQKKMKPNAATIEHLVPKSKSGTNYISNLRMSCYSCNSSRKDMNAVMWLKIVNDPIKLKAFYRMRQLRSQMSKRKRATDRRQYLIKLFHKYGICHEIIKIPNHVFDRLFVSVNKCNQSTV